MPVVESGNETWAPSGALFYSGKAFPQWKDTLLFTGLRSEALWSFDPSASDLQADGMHPLFQNQFGRLRAVAEGPDGSLYLATDNCTRTPENCPAGSDQERIIHIVPS